MAIASVGKKRPNFVSKLYRDQDDLNELKVLAGGDDNIDSDFEQKDEQGPTSERKREQKMKKKTEDLSFMKTSNEYTKIGKLVSNFTHP